MTAFYVLRRELRGLMYSPQTYGIGAAYLILSGIFFVNILITSEIPDLENYYSNIGSTLLVLAPIVAMRSFAEERRTGALDITLAWRASRTGVVLGKFGANTLYLWFLSCIVWIYYRQVGQVAQIQMGRTLGGFLGLLLMAMAFSALALMVSARAGSPAGAAFIGFGLLLFLWILDYAPGWIGDSLRALGPTQHFAAFPKGVIYWDDVAYFLLATLVGLGLALASLERNRPGRKLGSLVRRGAFLGVVLVIWGGTVAFAGDVRGRIDLTPEKVNSTTEATQDLVKKLGKQGERIYVTGFAASTGRDVAKLQDLVKQYRADGAKITLKIVDPDIQPGKARAAGVDGYGEALVELAGRKEVLKDPSQGAFTNVLLRLSRPTKPRLCFVAGHGERAIDDQTQHGLATLAGQLRYLGYETTTIGLAVPGAAQALPDCAEVIVAGPQSPFLPQEIDLLAAYAENNGRLLIMADAYSDEPHRQLNTVLKPWGVTLGDGIVRDASSLAGDPSSIVSLDYGSGASPPVSRLVAKDIPVVLTNSLAVHAAEGTGESGSFAELVRSSKKSWVAEAGNDQKVRSKGPFVLLGIADWSKVAGSDDKPVVIRTRIGVAGTAEMFTNRLIDVFGNRELAVALVQWIGQEDDLIAAGRPPTGFAKVILTSAQKDRLIKHGIVIPVFALLLPLPAVALRLRRG